MLDRYFYTCRIGSNRDCEFRAVRCGIYLNLSIHSTQMLESLASVENRVVDSSAGSLAQLEPIARQPISSSSGSPISSLPTELLAEIFLTTFKNHPESLRLDFLFGAMKVSKYWNEVLCGTPYLWTSIVISRKTPSKLLLHQLQRSKSLPIDLDIDLGPELSADTGTRVENTLNLIIPHAWHWGTMYILCHTSEVLRQVSQYLVPIEVPLLKTFRVCLSTPSPSPLPIQIFTRGAPALTSLYLQDAVIHFPQLSPVTFFHFRAVWMHPPPSIEILTPLSSLTTLTLWYSRFSELDGGPEVVDLPRLLSIALIECSSAVILRTITAPRLDSIMLGIVGDRDVEELCLIEASKFPVLRSLALRWHSLSLISFMSLSQLFPNVTHVLSIYAAFDDVAYLRPLWNPASHHHTVIWPKAKSIALVRSPRMQFLDNFTEICDMVAARAQQGSPLLTLQIDDNHFQKATDEMKKLKEYVSVERFSDDLYYP